MTRVVYRIIRHSTPTIEDFASARDLGKPLRDETMFREWAEGISVFDSVAYAATRTRLARLRLGAYVVSVCIPDDSDIEVRQTGNDRHHFTVYANSEHGYRLICGEVVAVGES